MTLSPLDDRYCAEIQDISEWFSESKLIENRVQIELLYVKHLLNVLGTNNSNHHRALNSIAKTTPATMTSAIKVLEQRTRHDVKAVEYWLRQEFQKHASLRGLTQWIHFGLTSEDVDSSAYGLCYKNTIQRIVVPAIQALQEQLRTLAG